MTGAIKRHSYIKDGTGHFVKGAGMAEESDAQGATFRAGPGPASLRSLSSPDQDSRARGPEGGSGRSGQKIFVLYNTARWLYRFRLPLMEALRARGYTVCGVSPQDEYAGRLEAQGFPHFDIPMNRKGTNPVEDGLLLARLHSLFRRERPDLILTYTVKPNVYGSLAARPLGIPVVNTVAGLGAMFVRPSLTTSVARQLYRHALTRSTVYLLWW